MEAAKKAALEKRLIVGLVCLFGVTFTVGLKNLGVFGRATPKTPITSAQEQVRIPGTLVETMQGHWKSLEPSEPTATPRAQPLGRLSGPLAYTAQELRDPLKSLLPELPSPAARAAAGGQHGTPQPAPVKRPPALTVRGVVWGGSEPEAIINDEVYRVGDTVESAKILSIDQAGVTIEHDGAPAFYPTAAPLTAGSSSSQQARWR